VSKIQTLKQYVFCDNLLCNWKTDVNYDFLHLWVDKPCPKCGENLLTKQAFSVHKKWCDLVHAFDEAGIEIPNTESNFLVTTTPDGDIKISIKNQNT
jgi:hypothetical protein